MKTFDQLRRLLGTAICFSIFGISGLIMGLVLFPLMFVFIRDSGIRTTVARGLIGKAFGGFVWLMRFVGVLDYRIEGCENIACRPGQLIVANHPTLIDVVILLSLFPQSNCVVKPAVMRNIFMKSTVGAANYISNDDPEELLDECIEYLRNGGCLLLFPEGTRTVDGESISFRPGAATIAARSCADVLPIAIMCKPIFLTRQLPWYYVPPTRPELAIRILPVVAMSDLVPIDDAERHIRQGLNNAILRIINRELDLMAPSGNARDELQAT